MAYNRTGYMIRAQKIKELTDAHYEPGNHARCKRSVWRRIIRPQFGICYITFLKYLQAAEEFEQRQKPADDPHQMRIEF